MKDESGRKDEFNDISCLPEARIEGRKSIVIANQTGIMNLAVKGAIDKIKTAIESILAKIQKQKYSI